MKKILTTLTLAVSGLIFAQVGINAGELSEGAPVQIATDAVFHVENASTSVHKGVLLPKVTLTSETDQTTTSGGTVTTGLMVWNNGGSGNLNPAGYYYWTGAKWVLTGNVDVPAKSFSKYEPTADDETAPKGTNLIVGYGNRKNVRLPQMTAGDAGTIIYVFKSDQNNLQVLDYQGLSSGQVGAVIRGQNSVRSNRGRTFIWDGQFWETVNY